jgi:hypothetical protein
MIVRFAHLVIAATFAATALACGGSSEDAGDDGTESADVSASKILPAGHYVNVSSDEDIGSAYWVEDVHIASNGTFTGVIGCGLSNCSGHQFAITQGHWIFHKNSTQIDFSYRYDDGRLFDDEHYDFRTGKDGAIQLRSQDHTFGATGWFTLEKQ